MEQQITVDKPLLQRIPPEQLSAKQKEFISENFGSPVFRLLREPTHLNDFNWDTCYRISVWRDSESHFCMGTFANEQIRQRSVHFRLLNVGAYFVLYGAIYGETDAAIAETATFLWSLRHPKHAGATLEIICNDTENEDRFDFATLQADQLAQILDSNPERALNIETGTWTAEQSVILATRPYSLNLRLDGDGVGFLDQGAAFLDALTKRHSSFGSLDIFCRRDGFPFSAANLRSVFELEVFNKLSCFVMIEDCALLPLSANVNVLEHKVQARYMQPNDFDSVNIVAKDLTFELHMERNDEDDWNKLLISFLNRVAELRHLERLTLSVVQFDEPYGFDKVARVAEALIRAIHANPKLSYLDLSGTDYCVNWAPHLQSIFNSMEEHPGLRTFVVQGRAEDYKDSRMTVLVFGRYEYERSLKFDFSWLEQLLSRNRNIVVLHRSGSKCSNGSTIDKLYALNGFYKGSAKLVTEESTSLRPLLVSTTLTKSASKKLPIYSAIALQSHWNVLRAHSRVEFGAIG